MWINILFGIIVMCIYNLNENIQSKKQNPFDVSQKDLNLWNIPIYLSFISPVFENILLNRSLNIGFIAIGMLLLIVILAIKHLAKKTPRNNILCSMLYLISVCIAMGGIYSLGITLIAVVYIAVRMRNISSS